MNGTRTAESATLARPRQNLILVLFLLPPGLYILLFFVLPILVMGTYSFGCIDSSYRIHVTGSLQQYLHFWTTPVYPRLLLKSLRMAAEVTLLCFLLGYPTAFLLAWVVRKRWRNFLLACLLLPSWTNLLIRTYAWLIVLGENGLINYTLTRLRIVQEPLSLLFNNTAVVTALICVYLPWMVLPIYTSLEKIDRALLEAASNLGAGALQLFRRIIFPLSVPGVVAGALVVFVPAIGTYLTPMILGGTRGVMYANAINNQFQILNWPFGSAMAMILLVIVLGGLSIYFRFFRIEDIFGLSYRR